MSALQWLVPLLLCPVCRGRLTFRADGESPDDGFLEDSTTDCAEVYPVIDGIPRLLLGPYRPWLAAKRQRWFGERPERRALAERWTREEPGVRADVVVGGFDYEWSLFRSVRTIDLARIFERYFDIVPPELLGSEQTVLDAGCGAGRWSCEVAARGPRVIALDLGMSVEVAKANAAATDRVGCVQADLRNLPIAGSSVDWAYSLGVLHHLAQPNEALRRLVGCVRPGGAVLLYLYYALDNRGPAYRALFHVVDLVRRGTSRLPRSAALVVAFCFAIGVYWPLARLSELLVALDRQKIAEALPLSFYRGRPLRMMLNDSLDRFGTRLERRYRREAVATLMRASGLEQITFSANPPYWHAIGIRQRE